MIIDIRELDDGSCIAGDVCIIGAGAAGIALALEFERRRLNTIVLESGGLKADEATRDLYRGHSSGLPYQFADGSRSRYLGGSTNCWGGLVPPAGALRLRGTQLGA